jgi:hypothetical protein
MDDFVVQASMFSSVLGGGKSSDRITITFQVRQNGLTGYIM